jgi:hypothetical protein
MIIISPQAMTTVRGSMAANRPGPPLCSVNGIPVSRADMLGMLDGAMMHNVTNLDTGHIVTLGTRKSCGQCDRGYANHLPFPDDGKKCARCRAVWYCDKVHPSVQLIVLFVSVTPGDANSSPA